MSLRRSVSCSLGLFFFASCATTSPRFEQAVATSFAQDDMRHLVTADVDVYYPAQYWQAAERVAARATECVRALRALQVTPGHRGPALLFLTSANYNNAYVGGQQFGEPLQALNPLFVTDELFHWYGYAATEPGDVSCHEMFHFAHYEQVENFWWFVNAALGPSMPSQAFLERWFTEGVAQYYEGRIRKNVGRPHSPLYRAAFESFVAKQHGRIGPGDLSLYQRELTPFTGAYLTSLYFIEWLAATYGEAKLWELMDLQGRSFFTPFGATLRFKAVYGLSVGALLDAWSATLQQRAVVRSRPPDQRVVREALGQMARLASDPATGALALVTQGNEEVPMLRILEPSGAVRVEQRLIRLGTDREWVLAGPSTMSGLSFSSDGRWLYVFNDDLTDRGDTSGQLWRIDARTGAVDHVWHDLGTGMGGALHPDGDRYTYLALTPGRATVTDFDLVSGQRREVLVLPEHVTVAALAWSPDGQRLVFSRADPTGWNLTVREPSGQLRSLTDDGAFNYGAKFSDPTHVVFAREVDGRLQVHRLDVDTLALEQLSEAPFGVVDPAPTHGDVAFINRDGTQWSLDVTPSQPRRVIREAAEKPTGEALVLAAQPAPPEAPPVTEAPASALDQLFVPQLRSPTVSVIGGGFSAASFIVGATLMGRDRLGKHSWLLDAAVQPVPFAEGVDRYVRASAEYRNLTLAPWDLAFSIGAVRVPGQVFGSAEAAVHRTVFTTDVAFGLRGVVLQSDLFRRFLGPSFSVGYGAGDSTAYGGSQHFLGLDFGLAAYPKGLGSSLDMLDVSAGVSLATGLPFSKRHNLVLALRGRVLPGAPSGALTVGGVTRGFGYSAGSGSPVGEPTQGYLPGSLGERLRGYETSPVQATAAATGELRYRYNLIIDRGFASTFYVLPSVFFRQVNFEAFGSAAVTDNPQAGLLRAAGVLAELKTLFGGIVPVSAYGQVAYRFDAGPGVVYSVGLSFD